MSLNVSKDLYSTYLKEVLKPEIAPKIQSSETKLKSDLDGDGKVDSFEKNVRQFIYDVRHLMKSNNIPVERAFQIRSSKTKYGAGVIKAAKEKLGIKTGGSTPVAEENLVEKGEDRLYKIVINYKNGTTYRKRTTQSEIGRLRSNPNVSSVEKTEYAPGLDYTDKKEKNRMDPVGQEDSDPNNDGKVDKQDYYILKKRRAIRKAIKKRSTYGIDEEYSNWREDLFEIVGDEISNKKNKEIKEKDDIDNKIKINPSVEESIENLGGSLLFNEDITEEFLFEEVKIAADYFYEQGLNEYGVEILIEKLGIEEFCNFVQDISEDSTLLEWRRGAGGTKVRGSQLTKKGKEIKTLKGGAKIAAIRGTEEHKQRAAERESGGSSSSGMRDALRSQSEIAKKRRVAVKTAAVKQPETTSTPKKTKKGILDRVAGAVLSGLERHKQATTAASQAIQRGMERHKQATTTASNVASQVGQTAGKVAKVGAKGASVIARGVASGVSDTATAAKKVKKAVVGEDVSLQEVSPPGFKGTVKAMKKHSEIDNPFALAWYMKKKGYKSHRKASGGVKEAVVDPSNPTTKKQSQTQNIQQDQNQQRLQQQQQKPQPQPPQQQQKPQPQQQQQKPQPQQQRPQVNTSAINQVLQARKNASTAAQRLANAQRVASQKKIDVTSLSA